MPWLACCLLLMTPSPPGDAGPPPSPVRARLDVAIAVLTTERERRDREFERITAAEAGRGTGEAEFEAAVGRSREAAAPAVVALLDALSANPADPASGAAFRFVLADARALPDQVGRALALLRCDHVRDADITLATGVLFLHHDKPEAIAFLRDLIADNPSRVERGRACLDLADLFSLRIGATERVRQRSPGGPDAARYADVDLPTLRAEAGRVLDRCVAEFADVPIRESPEIPGGNASAWKGKTVGELARGKLAAMSHLLPRMPAPEVVGTDLDGRPLRLSAFRGKVVVLVFSGEWCGPCRAAAVHLKALLAPEAQANAPCIVLEVNTDPTPDPVRTAVEAGTIAWPCWMDGEAGPNTLAWGVASFPTLYVIDPAGIIRARNIPAEQAGVAVARVLAEQPQPTRP